MARAEGVSPLVRSRKSSKSVDEPMHAKAPRTWFLTWTTYGTWLPGDRRGFVGPVREIRSNLKVTRNERGVPYEEGNVDMEAAARSLLRGVPIWLKAEQGTVVVDQIEETASFRRWRLLALAVMANHIHVVVTVPGVPGPEDLLRDLKAYASRALNARFGKPSGGTWWTRSGSKRACRDDAAIRSRVRYVRDQPNALCMRVYSAREE